jgi:hypothetical protein
MGAHITFDVTFNQNSIQQKVDSLINDEVMLEIHNVFAKMCDPYVPFLEGPLSQSGMAQVTSEFVQYGGKNYITDGRPNGVPYGRYQYYGDGFNHTKDYHPKATAHWDKAMMAENRDAFVQQLKDILVRRAKELYG